MSVTKGNNVKIGHRLIHQEMGVDGPAWQTTNLSNNCIEGWSNDREFTVSLARSKCATDISNEKGIPRETAEIFLEASYDEADEL